MSRILTTHCGSLPRSTNLLAALDARDRGQSIDEQIIATAVHDSVRRQADVGLDIVNDGEQSKTSFSAYVSRRLGGLTPLDEPYGYQGQTRDRLQFPDVYAE